MMIMMKNILLIFVLLLVLHLINCDEDVTNCIGEDVKDLPDTCRSIDKRPLR